MGGGGPWQFSKKSTPSTLGLPPAPSRPGGKDPGTTEAAVVEVLIVYGIKPDAAVGTRGRFYEWTAPYYWRKFRQGKFCQAILLAKKK